MNLLVDRESRCYCGDTRPSSDAKTGALAFFQFKGEGSEDAVDICKCGFHKDAHDPVKMRKLVRTTTVVEDGICPGFRARGPQPYDSHYCGCNGWD